MAIASDPYRTKGAIGQGLAGIAEPAYRVPEGKNSEAEEKASSPAPFTPTTGVFGTSADTLQEGLGKLMARPPSTGADASAAIPTTSLGLPSLASSSATGAARGSSSPSTSGLAGILASDPFGPFVGSTSGTPGSPAPALGDTALGGARAPTSIVNAALQAMGMTSPIGRGLISLGLGLSPAGKGLMATNALSLLGNAIANAMGFPHGNFSLSPDVSQALAAQRSGERSGFFSGPDPDTSEGQGPPGIGPAPSFGESPVGDTSAVGATGESGDAGGVGAPGVGVGDAGDAGYRRGGLVRNLSPAPGGEEPITAHEGEFVVNPEAASTFGPLLRRINRPGSARNQGLRRLLAQA